MTYLINARAAGSRARFALLVLGGLAGIMGVGAASAASADSDVLSIVVQYSDQSLATDAGVRELYGRITHAARQVCPAAEIQDLSLQRQTQECREHAVARAVAQINNPHLAALYASNSKRG